MNPGYYASRRGFAYTVQAGDTLSGILNGDVTHVGLVAADNGLKGSNIRAGQTLFVADPDQYGADALASFSRNGLGIYKRDNDRIAEIQRRAQLFASDDGSGSDYGTMRRAQEYGTSTMSADPMTDANKFLAYWNARAARHNAEVLAPNPLLSALEGKYALEFWKGWGGGGELSIKDGRLESVKLIAGRTLYETPNPEWTWRLGKADISAKPPSLRSNANDKHALLNMELGSAAPVPGEARLGVMFNISAGMSVAKLSSTGAVGYSSVLPSNLYYQLRSPEFVIDVLGNPGSPPKTSAKTGIEASYNFARPTLMPILTLSDLTR